MKLQPIENMTFTKLGSADTIRNARFQGGEMREGKVKLQPVENMTFTKSGSADTIRNTRFQGDEMRNLDRKVFTDSTHVMSVTNKKYDNKRS